MMQKTTLTVAIAAALAVPMAAQAVDVTLSGHVNRALFITDSDEDSSTSGTIKDNGSSGTRIRVKGTGEMMEGQSAGVLLEYGAGDSLGLRYADVWFSGGYGKVSIGHGDQGGEGSVYKGAAAVLGTGHGQDHNSVATGYYTSLDGGASRNERLRYDSPAVGPVSAAISVGNGDQVSAGLSLGQDFGGTSFSAGIGTIQWGNSDKSTISGSAGVTLAGGISISGAWGRGSNHAGATDPAIAAVAAVDPAYAYVDVSGDFDAEVDRLQGLIDAGKDNANAEAVTEGMQAATDLNNLIEDSMCDPVTEADRIGDARMMDENCQMRRMDDGMNAVPGVGEVNHVNDPSFTQIAVSYALGDTKVGLSWYRSSDTARDGSELTAVGVGVDHNLPKIGTNVYAAVQNYSIDDAAIGRDSDDSVVMIGARVKF